MTDLPEDVAQFLDHIANNGPRTRTADLQATAIELCTKHSIWQPSDDGLTVIVKLRAQALGAALDQVPAQPLELGLTRQPKIYLVPRAILAGLSDEELIEILTSLKKHHIRIREWNRLQDVISGYHALSVAKEISQVCALNASKEQEELDVALIEAVLRAEEMQ